ncbi:hypothetical protein Oweho_2037 [Owenweeksia hongkongensis DSM 17368]|uniref:LUD domain-containing protein n=1 Tax=Owenweeksia hongkongensis (strain DSM 17368 / CIP 108786 / JCM 12287 / NRRL B-23963 / UST20020801) TaxID=926562 RepID=G8R319_OWEHD|nr:LUD domain-containing protein [Owenweeksia hongkongensis]AEV33013.1 hypothetical protein Oweho_2037 [Owenweeksia hongkongensis DSM 17368]
MSSRNQILQAIRGLNQEKTLLPEVPSYQHDTNHINLTFQKSALANGSRMVSEKDAKEWLRNLDSDLPIFSAEKEFDSGNTVLSDDPHNLEKLEVVILKAQFAVAENGAMWFDDENLPERILPFITQHLLVLLDQNEIVGDMHEAYERIGLNSTSFGLFVAGPSKTADIEQSLVIGAHGAMSVQIILL